MVTTMKNLWNRIRKWLLKKLEADDYKDRILVERCDKNLVKLFSNYKQSIYDNTPTEVIIEVLSRGLADQIINYMNLKIIKDDYLQQTCYRAEIEVVAPKEDERVRTNYENR